MSPRRTPGPRKRKPAILVGCHRRTTVTPTNVGAQKRKHAILTLLGPGVRSDNEGSLAHGAGFWLVSGGLIDGHRRACRRDHSAYVSERVRNGAFGKELLAVAEQNRISDDAHFVEKVVGHQCLQEITTAVHLQFGTVGRLECLNCRNNVALQLM